MPPAVKATFVHGPFVTAMDRLAKRQRRKKAEKEAAKSGVKVLSVTKTN